jgi:hypothetical protein
MSTNHKIISSRCLGAAIKVSDSLWVNFFEKPKKLTYWLQWLDGNIEGQQLVLMKPTGAFHPPSALGNTYSNDNTV